MFLDEMPIERGALRGALRGRSLDGAAILVRADGRLPYGEVREVLELLAGEGVKSAGLETVRAPAPPDV